MSDSDLRFKEESYRIVGACFDVYRDKGNGFLEAVYQECLAIEFGLLINFGAYPKATHERLVG
jgi:hypothetical protein